MVEAAAVLKKLVLAVSAASVGGKSCVERGKRKGEGRRHLQMEFQVARP